MARHAKRRTSFILVPRGLSSSALTERRAPGASWERQLPERGFAVSDDATAPETDTLRRFLEAMRRQHAEEQAGKPVRITPEAIRQTTDYVLSSHLDAAQDSELGATVPTLRGYLAALADEAEAQLDTGRVVVREMVRRARDVADDECRPSRASARHAAQTTRDLLALLTREGWDGTPAEPKERASA